MLQTATVDAASTIMLLTAIAAMSPGKRMFHLFVDNVRCHPARLVQAWLAQPGRPIKPHSIPAYCLHSRSAPRLKPEAEPLN